ncbi:MAG: hypothetical protein HDQ92_00395 [Desulfovibrio sp.]|nr:hypothetical protein [Desulfovibrio sp.]
MGPHLMHYDAGLAETARTVGLQYQPEGDARELPLRSLAGLLSHLELFDDDMAAQPDNGATYYTLMEYRSVAPGYFPVHDLCLLMANVLATRLTAQGVAPVPVTLLDWGLLPVAVLLAGAQSPAGRDFLLPPAPLEGDSARRLISHLGRRLPASRWQIRGEGQELSPGAWLLAKDPLAHCTADSRFLERLAGIGGGVLLSSWDFLGVRIHAHTRSQWLGAGLIGGVLQLPRPRRQSVTDYPALLTLRPPAPELPLRMARIPSIQPGPGSLDQETALALLDGAPRVGASMELDAAAPARDGLFTLAPATWLTPPLAAPEGRTLRAFAQVLRCQLPRERLEEAIAWREFIGMEDGEAIFEWHDAFGEAPDGKYVTREISIGEFDPMTGFVDEHGGNPVKVALNPLGKQGKYLLQANDIVFAFRGTAQSVGKVGFVEELGQPAITGQSLCIIRALPEMDPVWLYYYLQQKDVVDFIRSRASGSNLLTVNLESIRDIPVAFPYRWEIDEINEEHRKISENMVRVTQLRRESQDAQMRIYDVRRRAEQRREQEQNQSGTPRRIKGRPARNKE